MNIEPFSQCICKTSIPSSHPYCLQNKSCLEYIIEKSSYLFEDSVTKSDIENYVRQLPIAINKKLTKKEQLIISELDEELQNKILSSPITPIDFLLPMVVEDFPNNIILLQKNPKMLNLGKEIRKKNFSKTIIDKLHRLALYFAIFFYESRTHTIWKVVLDSLIKTSFTPEQLLQYLDTLYRRDASEYMKFFGILKQNTSLTRIIYLLDSMQIQNDATSDKEEQQEHDTTSKEEIMSVSKLNFYAHHWFPGIVVSAIKNPDIYKTTLDRTYEELYNWKNIHQSADVFNHYTFYEQQPENPQKINPLYNDILLTIIGHKKTSSKLLLKEVHNIDTNVRKTIVSSSNITISILFQLQDDPDEIIRKIAQYKLTILKKEKELLKNTSENVEAEASPQKVVLAPDNIQNAFKEFPDTKYY